MLQTGLLVIHIAVAIALVVIIIVFQRSEGGMGFGTSSGSGSFMTARGTANFLTRLTATFAGLFMLTSIALAILAGNHGQGASILDQMPITTTAPATPGKPAVPAVPTPEVPLSK